MSLGLVSLFEATILKSPVTLPIGRFTPFLTSSDHNSGPVFARTPSIRGEKIYPMYPMETPYLGMLLLLVVFALSMLALLPVRSLTRQRAYFRSENHRSMLNFGTHLSLVRLHTTVKRPDSGIKVLITMPKEDSFMNDLFEDKKL